MKFITVLLLVALLGITVGIFAQDSQQSTKQTQGNQTECPVMWDEIDKNLYVDYQGKRIYVCCTGCLSLVKANPAKYIKILESKDVVLEKVPSSDSAVTSADTVHVHQY